jgi:hypothetical protein
MCRYSNHQNQVCLNRKMCRYSKHQNQVCLFSAMSWREQVNFQWDYDEFRFVLDQHAGLDFYSVVSVLALSVVDRGFKPRSSHTKDYKISMCCFSAKHASLRRKTKHCLTRNQSDVSECDDMSISLDCCFSELRQDDSLLRVLRFLQTIKLIDRI